MTWKKIYKELLKYCKETGIIVKHIPMSKKYLGEYDCDLNTIFINSKVNDCDAICKTLAHEIGHAIDFNHGRYPEFFNYLGAYTPRKMRLVIDAEQSASAHATDILAFFGKKVEFEEFDYFFVSTVLVPIWAKIYFTKK